VLRGLDPADWIGDKDYIGNGMLTPIRKPQFRDLLDWEKEFNKTDLTGHGRFRTWRGRSGAVTRSDHLERRAFVADLLLYDRLVVPTPSADDLGRWEQQWDPDRQARLLDILGPFAERMAWSPALREQFAREWSPADLARDIDAENSDAAASNAGPDALSSAYGVTRMIISQELGRKVFEERGDVRAIAVYAKPDHFDREWEMTRTMPFVRRTTRMRPGDLREVAAPESLERQRIAKVVVTRLVVPDDGDSDEEVLARTVDLVSRADVSARRAQFHQLLASLQADKLSDETIAGEVEDLLDALNESVRRHTKAQQARAAVQVLTTAQGAAALWVPPVGLAAGPTAAVSEAVIQRRWPGQDAGAQLSAVTLLAQARRALQTD
jgi:hypothetical protein